jgi:hypothetical protein
MNLTGNLQDFLNEWSARRKGATYVDQHKIRIKADKHQCLKWDQNPRSQCLSKH